MIPQIINHFTDDDLYKFTMCCAVIDNYPRACVKYAFTDRSHTAYPEGFDRELMRQVALLENVVITDEEIDFMRRRCPYIPCWFFTYLKGFRYRREWVKAWLDERRELHIEFEGRWSDVIMLEVKVLAIVSELYYIMTGQTGLIDLSLQERQSADKARRLIEGGCCYSDMGTRRRASFAAQDACVRAMASVKAAGEGRFVGTSNVYFAMKYDLMPIGTMAHEIVCAMAGMYGPQMANHLAMSMWRRTYRGALGTYLYDTYGWRIFSLNFSEDYANMFKGLRVDSGDNMEELRLIVDKYTSLGIDPRTRQIIFSNALDTDRAIALQRDAAPYCQPSFGIGTHFTNDFPGLRPMNIVIKLTDVKITEAWTFYNATCKLSEEPGKHTGNPEVVRRFMAALNL